MTLALYRRQNQRTQAYLSLYSQRRAGLELRPDRPMTDELLAHLTSDDLDEPNVAIEYPAEAA